MLYVAAYAAPAAAVWVAIGALVRPLTSCPRLLMSLAALYALRYGLAETLNTSLRPPNLAWQVPAAWVKRDSRPARALMWGALLGPGLLTRNPYAGIWLLPFLVGLSQSFVVAGLVGGVHGAARALGVLHNRRLACVPADVAAWGAYHGWRLLDGVLLLIGAGAFVGYGLLTLATR